uniref:Putative secreted protein n=1 Tax=Ixodes ricinus TaxID=34613 RepID=A0A147BSA0_IXORI
MGTFFFLVFLFIYHVGKRAGGWEGLKGRACECLGVASQERHSVKKLFFFFHPKELKGDHRHLPARTKNKKRKAWYKFEEKNPLALTFFPFFFFGVRFLIYVWTRPPPPLPVELYAYRLVITVSQSLQEVP